MRPTCTPLVASCQQKTTRPNISTTTCGRSLKTHWWESTFILSCNSLCHFVLISTVAVLILIVVITVKNSCILVRHALWRHWISMCGVFSLQDWEERYIHENYTRIMKDKLIETVSPSIYPFVIWACTGWTAGKHPGEVAVPSQGFRQKL